MRFEFLTKGDDKVFLILGTITGHGDSQLILHYSHATRMSRKAATDILEMSIKGKAKAFRSNDAGIKQTRHIGKRWTQFGLGKFG